MHLLQIAMPVFFVIIFIAWKIPAKFKKQFFRCPIWISSTALSWIVGSRLHGVLGPYAMFAMDMILLPAFWVMKRNSGRKTTVTKTAGAKSGPLVPHLRVA